MTATTSNFLSRALLSLLTLSSLPFVAWGAGVQFINDEAFACAPTFNLRWQGGTPPYTTAVETTARYVPSAQSVGLVTTGNKHTGNDTSLSLSIPQGFDHFNSTVIDNGGGNDTFSLHIFYPINAQCGPGTSADTGSVPTTSNSSSTQSDSSTPTSSISSTQTPSDPNSSPDLSPNHRKTLIGAIAGGVVGALVFICLLALLLYKRHKTKNSNPDEFKPDDIRRIDPFPLPPLSERNGMTAHFPAVHLGSKKHRESRRYTRGSSSATTDSTHAQAQVGNNPIQVPPAVSPHPNLDNAATQNQAQSLRYVPSPTSPQLVQQEPVPGAPSGLETLQHQLRLLLFSPTSVHMAGHEPGAQPPPPVYSPV
ncbi:hypothetical protein K435DRAFT_858988 [Dendrothele bispora CBS 962.96]|uniref:Mid2 domain-containing protein n=1 Tax=Dendrothele bispora (strain CBS 962.96) TaxID=1314807 RepID=A0A4S8M2U4_DENBC|nr:hypothetical protein K435DRAFT_858988 [Dendrothele bispora CBS 962.96]